MHVCTVRDEVVARKRSLLGGFDRDQGPAFFWVKEGSTGGRTLLPRGRPTQVPDAQTRVKGRTPNEI